jgi:hypothetical protein
MVVRVGEQRGQQPAADALAAVLAEHECVGEVSPGARVAAGGGHPLEGGQVDHAHGLAGKLGQPGDTAGGLALVPVGEPGLEPGVDGVAPIFRRPRPAERGQRRDVGRRGHSDHWVTHGVRAYRPDTALAPRGGIRTG